jgi:hypothetical protein
MATRTIPEADHLERGNAEDPIVEARARGSEEPSVVDREFAEPVRVGRFGVATVGLIALLVSAWGGIVAYVGPIFGFSGDGSASWTWNLAHSLLALIPGAAGVLLGLFVMGAARRTTVARGRLSLGSAGVLLIVCGAWFAIGPLAWPVLDHGDYFVRSVTPLRFLAYDVGYAIGTGLILVGCGGFVSGWAWRHRGPAATMVPESVRADATPVESAI